MEPSTEVDPRAALNEDGDSTERISGTADRPKKEESKPAPSAPDVGEVKEEQEDVLDTLKPKAEVREWKLRDERGSEVLERTYVQRPLSYFQKMEFFALVGEVIDKAVSGDDGLRVGSLFSVPGVRGTSLSAEDFQDADTFIQAVGKLLVHAPDFLKKCYCIWWSVPDYERSWAMEVMELPAEEGGLSDDEGIESIEIFIDQNWDALEAFFREKIASLRDRVQSHRQTDQKDDSQPSTPLSGTARGTESQ